jgi:uncharacterized membrane protein YfcA
LEIYFIGTIAVLLGAFLQGCLGFGFGMITVPPMLMMLAASDVVPMQIALGALMSVPLAWKARMHIQPMLVGPLILSAVAGLPLGTLILHQFDGPVLKLTIGIVLVSMSLAMLTGWSYPVKRQLPMLFPIGFLAGLMQTSFSMSGPPIILFLTNQGMDKTTFRANVLIFLSTLACISTVVFVAHAEYDGDDLKRMAVFIPAVMMGGLLGERWTNRIPRETFRRITLMVALVMGLLLVLRNLSY